MSYPSNITTTDGGSAVLHCVIENVDFSRTSISWWKEGDMAELTLGKMIIDFRYKISRSTDNHWSLVITNTTLHDSGTYICQINLKVVIERAFDLTVIKRPQMITQNDDSLKPIPKPKQSNPASVQLQGPGSVRLDDPFHLICIISPVPESTMGFSVIEWWLNDHRLQSTENHSNSIRITMQWKANDTMISYIYVQRAQRHHSGLWTCSFESIIKIPLWEKESLNEIRQTMKVTIKSNDPKERVERLMNKRSDSIDTSIFIFIICQFVTIFYMLAI